MLTIAHQGDRNGAVPVPGEGLHDGYRADEELLVNTHVYGVGAYLAPVVHLRHVPGAGLFTTYVESFERVWESARPLAVPDSNRVA